MSAIEARLDPMLESRDERLARLPHMRAVSLQGVLLKVAIAVKSVPTDENPEAHALLKSTLDDLRTLVEPDNRWRE